MEGHSGERNRKATTRSRPSRIQPQLMNDNQIVLGLDPASLYAVDRHYLGKKNKARLAWGGTYGKAPTLLVPIFDFRFDRSIHFFTSFSSIKDGYFYSHRGLEGGIRALAKADLLPSLYHHNVNRKFGPKKVSRSFAAGW